MEKVLTQEQEKETLEARWSHLLQLEGELKQWWLLSDEEEKRMNSVLRAINKYIEFLEQ